MGVYGIWRERNGIPFGENENGIIILVCSERERNCIVAGNV